MAIEIEMITPFKKDKMFTVVFYLNREWSYRILPTDVAQSEYEKDQCEMLDSYPTFDEAKEAAEKEIAKRWENESQV